VCDADGVVPGRAGPLLSADDDGRAASVNRLKPWLGSSGVADVCPRATKRFCAACLLTPMAAPMSDQDAPARRAWSTK
jgi:hypothetical protein